MKKIFILLVMYNALVACGGGLGSTTGSSMAPIIPSPTGAAVYAPVQSGVNVLPVIVSCGYMNEPCVSVTICEVGSTTNCRTVNNILLDTGSSGLRIFKSLVSGLNLNPVLHSGNELAEIATYADQTCQWGPLKVADIKLGGEIAPSVNVQIIDANYKTVPSGVCIRGAENDPVKAQYNGILGVGTRDQDCGANCTTATNGPYYSCPAASSSCSGSIALLSEQVRNPIAALATISGLDDSTGSMLMLPAIPQYGAISASGYLVMGVGTRANNTPSGGSKVFKTDSNGFFSTTFNSRSYPAFIDSGTNGLFFPPAGSQTPLCSSTSYFYCPSSLATFQATQTDGVSNQAITFDLVNAYSAFASANYATNVGGYLTISGSYYFDWGLPFFFGRSVYTGIYGKHSNITGAPVDGSPFYAY